MWMPWDTEHSKNWVLHYSKIYANNREDEMNNTLFYNRQSNNNDDGNDND